MALNTNAALMRLDPIAPLGIDLPNKQQSMERERLKLARQEFENLKQQQREQREMARLEEGGRMAREKMQQDQAAAAQQATAAAAQKKAQEDAIAKFTELAGTGKVEATRAMVPMLTALGIPVELQGEEAGLPRYRIGPDLEEEQRALADVPPVTENPYTAGQAQTTGDADEPLEQSADRMRGIGYPTDDTGVLEESAGIASSDDMTDEQMARVTGGGAMSRAATDIALAAEPPLAVEPDIGPPEPGADTDPNPIKPEFRETLQRLDPLGAVRPSQLPPAAVEPTDENGLNVNSATMAVPKNVIDMGAMQAQTLARLNPALEGIIASYPEEYRESARKTANAVRGMGLPAAETVELMDKLRGSPDSLIRADIQAESMKGENANKAEAAGDKEAHRRYVSGFNVLAKEAANKYQVEDLITRRGTRAQIENVLTNKSKEDDYMAGAGISRMMGEKGSTTEPDIARALGTASMGFFQRIKAGLYHEAIGGLSIPQRNSLVGVLRKAQETDEQAANDFMKNVDELVADPETDKDVGRGLRDYVKVVIPPELRAKYRKAKEAREAKGKPRPNTLGVTGVGTQKTGARTPSGPAAYTSYKPPTAGTSAAAPSGPLQNDREFMTSLDAEAKARNLDPDKMLAIMGPESGGDPAAKNSGSSASGLIQMMDSTAKNYINPRTDKPFESAAELRELTRAEQAPIAAQYFADKGVTEDSPVEDYALAVAAPAFVGRSAERDAVIYPKGSAAHTANRPWWPKDGGPAREEERACTRCRAARDGPRCAREAAPPEEQARGARRRGADAGHRMDGGRPASVRSP
jgi:hypothetical protein